jgi:hypothetical protein
LVDCEELFDRELAFLREDFAGLREDDFFGRNLFAGLAAAFAWRTAFRTVFCLGSIDLPLAARLPRTAPITPPTTVPTGPATLPSTAPVAAPAACFEIGGISMFSDAGVFSEDDASCSSAIWKLLLDAVDKMGMQVARSEQEKFAKFCSPLTTLQKRAPDYYRALLRKINR